MDTPALESRISEIERPYEQRPNMNKGIQALFNADLYTVCPQAAPREEWVIYSPLEIVWLKSKGMRLSTKQKDALVWFRRLSPESMSPYDLADRLAGGKGKHPHGARTIIGKLLQCGYLEDVGSDQFRITPTGRDEANRIRRMREKRGKPVIAGNPPPWATAHIR